MKFLCSFFALLIGMCASAQIKFETGYFVDNGGQKTECLIRNVDWQHNPTGFDYKASETSEVKKASLENVKSFEVGDFSFERWTVDIDRSTAVLSDMTQDRNPAFRKEMLFLRLIFDSPVKLFQYSDSSVSRYFFSSADAVPEQLVFKEYRSMKARLRRTTFPSATLQPFEGSEFIRKGRRWPILHQKRLAFIVPEGLSGNGEK